MSPEEDEELITALPRDEVCRACRALQPSRHRAQQLIAGGVPEAVVDELEVVQVDEEDGGRALFVRGPRESVVEPLLEGDAVREARQRIVEGDVLELAPRLLEGVGFLATRGDVGDDPVDEELAFRATPWAHAVPDPARLAVVADEAVLELDGLAGLEPRQEDVVVVLVVRVDGLFPRFLRRAVLRQRAEEALEAFADEGVADVRPVLEVLGLVEVDGDGAGDAPEHVRRSERFCERVLPVVRCGGFVGHARGASVRLSAFGADI